MHPISSLSRLPVPQNELPLNGDVTAARSPVVVRRGSDILATVTVHWHLGESAESVVRAACTAQRDLPHYQPDGAGAILVFHTESGCHVLGGVRENPALKDQKTDDGSAFPLQMTTTLGGRVTAPERSLKDLLVDGVRGRLLPKASVMAGEDARDSVQLLEKLSDAIAAPDGWESGVCIHTDKWTNRDGSESTMCYLTATKHLKCADAQLEALGTALASSMAMKRTQGEDTRTLMSFCFAKRDTLVANAIATYALDEKAKAEQAYRQFGSEVAVTFNDLAVATLAQNGGLVKEHAAVLV